MRNKFYLNKKLYCLLVVIAVAMLCISITMLFPAEAKSEIYSDYYAVDECTTASSTIDELATTVLLHDKCENEYDGVLSPSGLTSDDLSSGLYYPLSKYSEVFIEAEKQTGVNAVFLSSVAALESGWGSSNVSIKNNNVFGWSFTDGSYMRFNSKQECILYVAEKLKETYLTKGAIYFNGTSVEAINISYNGHAEWEDSVNQIMSDILFRIEKSKGGE